MLLIFGVCWPDVLSLRGLCQFLSLVRAMGHTIRGNAPFFFLVGKLENQTFDSSPVTEPSLDCFPEAVRVVRPRFCPRAHLHHTHVWETRGVSSVTHREN